mmetsp:Transcript_2891/g.9808  ORF Transcript_2891/g.9808 Transcript_2891/m.9808 type:complete len:203 (-) Transcript_2891:48-656(-)
MGCCRRGRGGRGPGGQSGTHPILPALGVEQARPERDLPRAQHALLRRLLGHAEKHAHAAGLRRVEQERRVVEVGIRGALDQLEGALLQVDVVADGLRPLRLGRGRRWHLLRVVLGRRGELPVELVLPLELRLAVVLHLAGGGLECLWGVEAAVRVVRPALLRVSSIALLTVTATLPIPHACLPACLCFRLSFRSGLFPRGDS